MESRLRKVKKYITHPYMPARWALVKTNRFVRNYYNYGTNIFKTDWDALVILDACRYDLFTEWAPKHDVYDEFDSVDYDYSLGTATWEWLSETFDGASDKELADTYIVSGNPQFLKTRLRDLIDVDRLAGYEDVFEYGYSDKLKSINPEAITNAAIRCQRDLQPDRLLIHYVQPHAPFIHCPNKYGGRFDAIGGGAEEDPTVWTGVADGIYDKREVWMDYGRNLSIALDHVEVLVENLDGKIVITSDHGNFFNYLRLRMYQHPSQMLMPAIKRVPWVVATGKGHDTYEVLDNDEICGEGRINPKEVVNDVTDGRDHDIDEMLRNLGYVD
jgi:hypothetical protein